MRSKYCLPSVPLSVLLTLVLLLSSLWLWLMTVPSLGSLQNSSAFPTSIETASLRGFRGPWYQVYFTKPHYPETPAKRVAGLDETLVADIDQARRRIELLSFDFDLPQVAHALLRAHQRGVAVRISLDSENLHTPAVAQFSGAFETAGIPIFYDRRSAFMHNKIIVIDDQIVWTGSWNLTINDTFRNNNNVIRIADTRLVANYAAKAERIFEGAGGPGQSSVLKYRELALPGATVANAFAPEDPITELILKEIAEAHQRIDVLAFVFTSERIAAALVDAQNRGVTVRVVIERGNARGNGSKVALLQEADIDLRLDGNCYKMHHKVMIIDNATVITGSFNFTEAAQRQNDENILIVRDRHLAVNYSQEFERIYAQALRPARCD
jgi:phosphatidylserine/phosphatidylglycerophosphate/cardiolipin synthase-like enzyme